MAKTLDELRALVNTMTHRQLVRYLKTLKGGSVGFDYMKESRDDMVRRLDPVSASAADSMLVT